MLDRLRLFVPFRPDFVTGGTFYASADAGMRHGHAGFPLGWQHTGVALKSADILMGPDGLPSVYQIQHRTEQVWCEDGTAHTPLGLHVHTGGDMWPGVELRASPAKLLQGHNVFGPRSIEQGAIEMLGMVAQAFPKLYDMLEVESCDVWELDATFSAQLPSEMIAKEVIRVLQGISKGQTKSRGDAYSSTCYWGSKDSRLKKLKAYLKYLEFLSQLAEYRRLAPANPAYQRLLEICEDERLQAWAKNLLRFESTIKKRWLERRNMPSRLTELVKLQRSYAQAGRCLLVELFNDTFKDVFSAFEGTQMRIHDDDQVLAALKAAHVRTTRTGKTSYAYAMRLFGTYELIRNHGWHGAISRMCKADNPSEPSSTFYNHIGDICTAGFQLAYLQSLNAREQDRSNVYPLMQFVKVNFDQQYPDWYVEPVSRYAQVA